MLSLPPFETELFFVDYEFTTPHNLAASDCETVSIGELLDLAGSNVTDLMAQKLGYTETWGNPDLREQIANRYPSLNRDQVLVLGSPIEGLFLMSRHFSGETIVLTPAYDALKNLPSTVKTWPLLPTPTGWELDFETLNRLVSPQTELLVVNFPHNPTGFVPSPAQWHQLVKWAQTRDIWLFCDEIYQGLLRPDTPPIESAVDLYDKAVVLGGLSKSHGLPGLRSGWLASQDRDLLKKLHDLKLYTSMCPAAPTEFLSQIALSVEGKLVARSNRLIEENLRIAETFFARHQDVFHWRRPLGASVGLAELLAIPSAQNWTRELAQQHGVVLLPSSFLGFPDKYVRFGLGRRSFPSGLKALEQILI